MPLFSVGQSKTDGVLVLEGYFRFASQENIEFLELNDGKLIEQYFFNSFHFTGANKHLLDSLLSYHDNGIYVALLGEVNKGGHYGHMGFYENEVCVREILLIDKTKTLSKYFKGLKN